MGKTNPSLGTAVKTTGNSWGILDELGSLRTIPPSGGSDGVLKLYSQWPAVRSRSTDATKMYLNNRK